MDLISVVVPIYNVEPYLARCVNSIRNQTYQNLEIILVDDGSPDRCPELCDLMQQEDSRIKVIHKENGGQGLARNSGLEIATGDYVTFIDSDDWIAADHVENLYQKAKETNADAVIGGYTGVSPSGEKRANPPRLEKRLFAGKEILEQIVLPLVGAEPCSHHDMEVESSSSMTLYRMAILKNHQLQYRSERVVIAEDLFFNIDFLCHAKSAVVIDEAGYYYFENHSSTSWRYDAGRFERTLNFYSALQKVVDRYGIKDVVGFRVERTFLMKVRLAIRNIVLSGLATRDKIEEIKKILKDPVVEKVLTAYPINSMIPAMRLLSVCMRRKNAVAVYMLMYFRESARRKGPVRDLLKRFGIGK